MGLEGFEVWSLVLRKVMIMEQRVCSARNVINCYTAQ